MDISYFLNKNFPKISFNSTSGIEVLANNRSDWIVIYIYPMIPEPETTLPEGWLSIPGAAGCTSQSCTFRDHYSDFIWLNVKLFGLSSLPIDQQLKAKKRLDLPFELISDDGLTLKRTLGLPTFHADGMEYYERLTLILLNGMIKDVFYPVSNPQAHVHDVLSWLKKTEQENESEVSA